MTIWKLLGLAALVTAAATVLLTTTTASAGGKEDQTLVWWHNVTQGPGVKLYKDIAAEFQKQHPGITIKAVPLQNEQFKTKIPIALQSDSPPDVFQSWGGGGLVDQQKAGKVADLTKYVKPWIKSIGGTAAGWQVNGKQYAVPYSVGVVGFWYNKQLFKQAGIASAPKTWPQFLVRRRQAQAGGDHADRHRQQGRVAGCVLLGLPRHEALQQAGDAVVGGHVQLRQSAAGRRRASTSSSCSTQSRSRTASWRRRRSRARRAPQGWSRTARRRWSSRDTGTQG